MPPARILEELSPYVRMATAVAPFAAALILRLIMGKSRFSHWLITLSTMWFALNVLLTPYSAGMRRDLETLRSIFR